MLMWCCNCCLSNSYWIYKKPIQASFWDTNKHARCEASLALTAEIVICTSISAAGMIILRVSFYSQSELIEALSPASSSVRLSPRYPAAVPVRWSRSVRWLLGHTRTHAAGEQQQDNSPHLRSIHFNFTNTHLQASV